MGGLRYAVLGPLEVWAGERRVRLAGRQQPVVLAALLLNAGRVVSVDRLVECLWGADPPTAGRRLVHGCVAELRRVLRDAGGGQPVLSRAPGYLVEAGPAALDLAEFTELAAAGRAAAAGDEPARAAELLAAAGRLWRGPVLDGVVLPAFAGQLAGLGEDRLTVLEDRIEADLRLGRSAQVVGELPGLVAAHPLRERLWAQSMIALAGADRRADALAAYQRVRTILVDELGIEPGSLLREVHQAVLAGTDPLAALRAARPGADRPPDPPGAAAPAAGRPVPAQLPTDVAAFSGRSTELAALTGLLTERPGAAVVISAVSGTAGVGKTALAVHWAHRVADRFPDGHLYVNLRGFDPGGQLVPPEQAIRGFLDALGVPPERLPTDLDAQTALYRSLLAGNRILVVLDNARDADQVRPLLPGTPTALALITSRNQLAPLVAAEAARPLALDLLTEAESHELLERRLGAGRIAAEPGAVELIIGVCARLPLALALVAARAATHASFPLAAIAADLAEAAGQASLPGGPADMVGRVRAVFSWSYTTLTPDAARLFRLLGLHPGPDTTAPAAASLAGVAPAEVRPLLTELVQAGLLGEHAPGRYADHDLLTAYAADLAQRTDTDDDRDAATTRLLDYYLHTAYAAERLLNPGRDPIPVPLAPPTPGTMPEHPSDERAAGDWLTTEHRTLLAVLDRAAAAGYHTHAWQLVWSLDTYLDRRGHWPDLTAAWQTALHAAGRLDHRPARAYAHGLLAWAHARPGKYADAIAHLHHSLDLYTAAGDLIGQAHTHRALAYMSERIGRSKQALDHARQALTHYQATGYLRGQATVLNSIGWYHARLGQHAEALTWCSEALTLLKQIGDRDGVAHTWDSLGLIRHHLGHRTDAVACYQRAIDLFHDLGDRYNKANSLNNLGDTHDAAGRRGQARTAWTEALAILTDLGHPDADGVRAKLRDLDG